MPLIVIAPPPTLRLPFSALRKRGRAAAGGGYALSLHRFFEKGKRVKGLRVSPRETKAKVDDAEVGGAPVPTRDPSVHGPADPGPAAVDPEAAI